HGVAVASGPGWVEADHQRTGGLRLGLACLRDQLRRNVTVVSAHLECLRSVGGVFLLEKNRIEPVGDLVAAAPPLLVVEAVERRVVALLGVEHEIVGGLPAILLLPEPGHKDRDVRAAASLGLAPAAVKEITDPVGGAFEDAFGAGRIRDRLENAG